MYVRVDLYHHHQQQQQDYFQLHFQFQTYLAVEHAHKVRGSYYVTLKFLLKILTNSTMPIKSYSIVSGLRPDQSSRKRNYILCCVYVLCLSLSCAYFAAFMY